MVRVEVEGVEELAARVQLGSRHLASILPHSDSPIESPRWRTRLERRHADDDVGPRPDVDGRRVRGPVDEDGAALGGAWKSHLAVREARGDEVWRRANLGTASRWRGRPSRGGGSGAWRDDVGAGLGKGECEWRQEEVPLCPFLLPCSGRVAGTLLYLQGNVPSFRVQRARRIHETTTPSPRPLLPPSPPFRFTNCSHSTNPSEKGQIHQFIPK